MENINIPAVILSPGDHLGRQIELPFRSESWRACWPGRSCEEVTFGHRGFVNNSSFIVLLDKALGDFHPEDHAPTEVLAPQ